MKDWILCTWNHIDNLGTSDSVFDDFNLVFSGFHNAFVASIYLCLLFLALFYYGSLYLFFWLELLVYYLVNFVSIMVALFNGLNFFFWGVCLK